MSSGGAGILAMSTRSGDAGGAEMEDASTFIAENLLSFSPNPELYLLSGFDR
jgi:hypothetical protein